MYKSFSLFSYFVCYSSCVFVSENVEFGALSKVCLLLPIHGKKIIMSSNVLYWCESVGFKWVWTESQVRLRCVTGFLIKKISVRMFTKLFIVFMFKSDESFIYHSISGKARSLAGLSKFWLKTLIFIAKPTSFKTVR